MPRLKYYNTKTSQWEYADNVTGSIPVRGVDYWTEADQESIVQQVITALGTPVFGTVDADKRITLTTDRLADGIYELGYEDKDGNWVKICDYDKSSEPEPSYTNLADTESADWLNGKRLNSSGEIKDAPVSYTTNYIPLKNGDVVRVRGLNIFIYSAGADSASTHFYNADKTRVGTIIPANNVNYFGYAGATEEEIKTATTDIVYTVGSGNVTMVSGDATEIQYARFVGRLMSGYNVDDIIITVNEPIE